MRPTVSKLPEGQEYPFGWRDVNQGGEWVRIPLTLEDCLYPQEGDVRLEGSDHDHDCVYLANVFRSRPLSPEVAFVTRDMSVNWGHPEMGNHSPDVGVWVGLSRDPRPTALLDVKGLGARCEPIVEVVSPSTRDNDVVTKRDHYHKVGVPLYVIIDQDAGEGSPRWLRAYRWAPAAYQYIRPDDQGRVALPILGLMLGVRDRHAVCFDAATGEEIADFSATRQDLLRTRQNLADERERRRQFEDEVDRNFTEQQDELKRQREAREAAEKLAREQREAAEKQARQELETAQKLAQQQRDEFEKQLRELREQLSRSRGGSDPTATDSPG